MRLLSKKQVQSQSLDVENVLQGKLNVLRDAITKATVESNLVLERVKAERELGEAQIASIRLETQAKIASLKAEIDTLETRKKEALKPLNDVKTALLVRENDVLEREKAITLREHALSAKEQEVLQSYEDIADRQVLVREAEEEIERRAEGVRLQSSAVSEQAKALTERMADSALWAAKKTREISDKTLILNAREEDLRNREAVLVIMRDEIARGKRANESERAAINAAFEELRKKKI